MTEAGQSCSHLITESHVEKKPRLQQYPDNLPSSLFSSSWLSCVALLAIYCIPPREKKQVVCFFKKYSALLVRVHVAEQQLSVHQQLKAISLNKGNCWGLTIHLSPLPHNSNCPPYSWIFICLLLLTQHTVTYYEASGKGP